MSCNLFRHAVYSTHYSSGYTDRLSQKSRVSKLFRSMFIIHIYPQKEGERSVSATWLQNSRSRNAKFEQVRKRRCGRNTICPNSGPTTVYLSFHARCGVSHRHIPRYLAQTRSELRETRRIASPRSIFARPRDLDERNVVFRSSKRRRRRSVAATVVPRETNGRDSTSLSGRRF